MTVRVAIVVASHSDLLARGVVELAQQMAADVHFEAAGGTQTGGIGTSFDKIEAAVNAALLAVGDSAGGGVLILTDLGSATMTVESVLDFADDPEHLQFVEAPLVEGCVAAAVKAQLGDPLSAVAQAAAHAWDRANESAVSAPPAASPAAATSGAEVVDTAVVADQMGIHARPAAQIAQLAATFDASISINGVDAVSVLALLTLGVKHGETVTVRATGVQAVAGVSAVKQLLETAA